MTIEEFRNKFKKVVAENQNFIITIHKDPDGDCIGGQFALYLFLKHFDKNIRIINSEQPPFKYDFLGLSDKVETQIPDSKNYILFMLDYNEKKMSGEKFQKIFENYKQLICIDHHQKTKNTVYTISYIDSEASSVCEILYLLLKDEIQNFTPFLKKKFANCFYTGLIYDTNNFINKNVSARTYEIAKDLFILGADNNLCSLNIFENRKTAALKLLGKTLSTLKTAVISDTKKVAYYITTQEMLKECNLEMKITSNFSKEVKPLSEREVVIYFREMGKDNYRVSLRSLNIDVQKIAKEFGGGGHKLAAGFTVEMEFSELKQKILNSINSKTLRRFATR